MGYEKFDLLWHGKKIAGAAQRRDKSGLLIQGSVQPPLPVNAPGLRKAMLEAARKDFAINWASLPPDETFRDSRGINRAGEIFPRQFQPQNARRFILKFGISLVLGAFFSPPRKILAATPEV